MRWVFPIGVLVGAYLWDRVMSLVHEVLHVSWAIVNRSEFRDSDIYFLGGTQNWPIGARDMWHPIPQFYASVDQGTGILPYQYNPLFATIGMVVISILVLWWSDRIETRAIRWIVTVGAIYTGFRFALYSSGLVNHPRFEDGTVVAGLQDGRAILEGFGPIGMIPGIVAVGAFSVVVYHRFENSRDACQRVN